MELEEEADISVHSHKEQVFIFSFDPFGNGPEEAEAGGIDMAHMGQRYGDPFAAACKL